MPITSAEKGTTLNPGQSASQTNFKGAVRLKNGSSNFEASYTVQVSGNEQKGRLGTQQEASIDVAGVQKEVVVTNASKEAPIFVEFVPR